MKDRAAALALVDYEAGLCTGCGEPMSECHDPDNKTAYEVLPPVRCYACTALEITHDGINAENTKQPGALRWIVRLKERVSPGRGD